MKVLIICAIIIGEGLSIYAELLGAKRVGVLEPLAIFWRTFPIIVVGMALLLFGYIYGIITFKDIWVVSVASILSILIIEPILIYWLFHELPARGTLVGFILGVLGFVAVLFYK